MDGQNTPDKAAVIGNTPVEEALVRLDQQFAKPAGHYANLVKAYQQRCETAQKDPLKNPIQGLSGYVAASVLSQDLSLEDLSGLVQYATTKSAIKRASRQAEYIGLTAPERLDQQIVERVQSIARDADGSLKPFTDFQAVFEREFYGLVLTAHPTFMLPKPLIPAFAGLVEYFGDARELSDQELATKTAALNAQAHGWVDGVTLTDEHELSIEALQHIQAAVGRFLAVFLNTAAELYPDDWTALQPRPITLASWVGYDLDGRSDIRWSDTLRARLILQEHQLRRYTKAVSDIIAIAHDAGSTNAVTSLKLMASRLDYALRVVGDDLASLPAQSDDHQAVQAFGQLVNRDRDIRLTNHQELLELLDQAIADTPSKTGHQSLLSALVTLRAEIRIYGLGLAHTHVRLNATQIMNAVRGDMADKVEVDRRSGRRQRTRAMDQLLDQAAPQSINFGSILAERTSAKRLFMLVAQMLKHIDNSAPVRFLIAECEEAATVLAALYYARIFGIDEHLDISPLFETDAALQRGDQMIAELLSNKHFCDYVEKRGRLCIQTGFSDAGRYLGQVAASLAIERLRIKIGRLLAQRGLKNVDLVIFDTHGESIGRGSHPQSFKARLDHVFPPANRQYFNALGLSIKQETSFQGGDGYLFFATDNIAYATMTQLITHGLTSIPGPQLADHGKHQAAERLPEMHHTTDDGFYQDTDYSLDYFIGLADFNEKLVDDPHYAGLLGLFATNMLFPTGSRAVKRQHEKGGPVELASVSQIRAIPHNGVLQQMGYMANSCGGIGSAIGRDQERFWEVFDRSDRCQQFMALAAAAYDRSDLDAFLAYINLVDPSLWLQRSMHGDPHADACEWLAQFFQQAGRFDRVWPAAQTLLHDALRLREALDNRARRLEGVAASADDEDHTLAICHALRLAMIQALFILVTRIPRFTSQPDVTMEEVRAQLLSLDVPVALEALKRAFPPAMETDGDHDYGETASYETEGQQGYDIEHAMLFEPIEQLYRLIRETSSAIAHQIGAVG